MEHHQMDFLYDEDDKLTHTEVGTVFSKEQWYVFRITWPTQLFWLVLYAVIAFTGYTIVWHAAAKAAPVCIKMSDAYSLALADTQGTGIEIWNAKVASGDCGMLEAIYLRTLDLYTSDEPTRVVEMLAFGQSVYGLITALPHGVWSIRWDEKYAQADPSTQQWYNTRTMTEETRKRLGVTYKSCCNHGDVVHTEIRRTTVMGNTEWYWLDGKEWKHILQDIIQYGQFPPGNQPVLFVYNGEAVCFFPQDVGGI